MPELVLSIVALFLSVAALLISYLSFRRDNRLLEMRHANGVSIHTVTGEEGENDPLANSASGSSNVLLINSGDYPVVVHQIGVLIGEMYAIDRSIPASWKLIGEHIHWRKHLLPGRSIVVPEPDTSAETGLLGPAAIIEDSMGNQWLVTQGLRRRIPPSYGWRHKPTRMSLWIDQHSKATEIFAKLQGNAIKRQNNNPARIPLWPSLLAWFGEWRVEPIDRTFGAAARSGGIRTG